MLFDPRPKERREDFFDREHELKLFIDGLRYPLSLILGLRRTGKTSLLLVGLKEAGYPHVIVDCRNLPINPSKKDIMLAFQEAFNQMARKHRKIWDTIKDYMKNIKGVEVLGIGISISWKKASISSIIDEMDEWARDHGTRIVLAFDEFQQIRGARQIVIMLAHIYDYRRNISTVLTGSEMGLLYGTLALDDPDSPLYGRYVHEVRLENFSRELSLEFLKMGFKQYNMHPNTKVLEYAVEKFNGIPGWLTFFGAKAVSVGKVTEEIVDEIFEMAVHQAISEINNFLKLREAGRRRYVIILKSVAEGTNRWSEIKRKWKRRKEGNSQAQPLQHC